MHGVADHSLFGNKQQLNTNKLFSNIQWIKHYIVIKENKEDGERKCEKANSQRHFNSAQLYTQMRTQSETLSPCQGKGVLLLNNNTKTLL